LPTTNRLKQRPVRSNLSSASENWTNRTLRGPLKKGRAGHVMLICRSLNDVLCEGTIFRCRPFGCAIGIGPGRAECDSRVMFLGGLEQSSHELVAFLWKMHRLDEAEAGSCRTSRTDSPCDTAQVQRTCHSACDLHRHPRSQ
jgi:hypothetical protein